MSAGPPRAPRAAAGGRVYLENGQLDRSREVVRRAQKGGHWIAPELLEQLRKAPGRDR